MTQIKDRLECPGLHLEIRKGTRVQARDYCCKDDTRIPSTETVHLGKFRTRQGHRTDVEQVADAILDGATESQIGELYPSQYLRMSTHVRRLINLQNQKNLNRYRKVDVHVLWGQTRSGKTRQVFDRHGPENVFKVTINEAGKLWFDGYSGQKVLLLDEFYGQLRVNALQNLLDNYCAQYEIKGGTIVSNWDTIYITSNCNPDLWYSQWSSIPVAVKHSISERFTTITELKRARKQKKIRKFSEIPTLSEWRGFSITPATSESRIPISKAAKRRRRRQRRKLRLVKGSKGITSTHSDTKNPAIVLPVIDNGRIQSEQEDQREEWAQQEENQGSHESAEDFDFIFD